MKKILNTKNIAYLSLILGMLGMINEVVGFLIQINMANALLMALIYLEPFSVIKIELVRLIAIQDPWIKIVPLFFYFLLFLGAVFSLLYSFKEVRLLRFSYALIFAVSLISIFYPLAAYFDWEVYNRTAQFYTPLTFVRSGIMAIVSFGVLRVLSYGRALSDAEIAVENQPDIHYKAASIGQRFLNHVIDLVLSLVLFFQLTMLVFGPFLNPLTESLGDNFAFYTVGILSRLIYYILFESLFQSTFGKYLTETRVATVSGEPISFGTAIFRNLYRFIPLEPFTMFSKNAWHDELSKTKVYQEQNTGAIKSKKYLWLFPFFVAVVTFAYWGAGELKHKVGRSNEEKEHEQNVVEMKHLIEHPDTGQFYALKEVLVNESWKQTYLKVESFTASSIVFSVLDVIRFGDEQAYNVRNQYDTSKNSLKKVEVNKELLLQAITEDYQEFSFRKFKLVDLFKNGKGYSLHRIDRLYAPMLKGFRGSFLRDGDIFMFITNYGASGRLVAIENNEGTDIQWMKLPAAIEEASTSSGSQPNYIQLKGSGAKLNVPYKFKFIVEDDMKRRSTYEVEGINDHSTLLRLD